MFRFMMINQSNRTSNVKDLKHWSSTGPPVEAVLDQLVIEINRFLESLKKI